MYNLSVKIKGCSGLHDLPRYIESNHVQVILFGEYHGFVGQRAVQKKIIEVGCPDFFLYEMLENKKLVNGKEIRDFLSEPNEKEFSYVSKYGALKEMVRLARNFRLPVIGCDLKNMGCERNWRITKFSEKEAKRITYQREAHQIKVINQYCSKGRVFAVLGAYHLRKNSLVLSKLKGKKAKRQKGKKALLVIPSFTWKEKFNTPKNFKKSEISYTIKRVERS